MPTQAQNDRNLFSAARTGDVLIARVSLRDGANPNLEDPNYRDSYCYVRPCSPLALAVSGGHREVVEMLLAAGAKVPDDERRQREFAQVARGAGCPATLLLLFQNGLRPTRQDADWADEHGQTEVKKHVLDHLGEYAICYDIDQLLKLEPHQFYSGLAESIPDTYSPREKMLYPQERVLRDLWEFEICTGSGFSTMLSNQMYDVVERSYHALQAIGASNALSAVSELRSHLQKHGIPERLDPDPEVYDELSDEAWEQIEHIDQKYFGGPRETDIWTDRTHFALGIDYAKKHIKLLRKRKPK